MSDFKFACPHCNQHMTVDDSWIGHAITCAGCQNQITVPTPLNVQETVADAAGDPAVPETAEPDTATDSSGGGKTMLLAAVIGVVAVIGAGVGGFLYVKSKRGGGNVGGADSNTSLTGSGSMTMGMNMGDGGGNASAPGGAAAPVASGEFPSDHSWPQWRGPNRDGVSNEKGLAKQWPAGGPPLLWKTRGCGGGFSSVAVAGGRVFTMGDGGQASAVHCFEEATGNKLWSSRSLGRTGGNYEGTKSTPTVDGDRVYALGQFGDLVCLNVSDGGEVWRKNLTRDFAGQFSQWNYSESVLVDEGRLIVSPGGRGGLMLALNKMDASPVWRTREWTDEVQYVSPIISNLGGRKHYVQLTQQTLAGVDAETGRIIWSAQRKGATAVIPTPVIYNNIVFVTSGYGVGCNAFQVGGSGGRMAARQIYANRDLVNHHGGVVLVGQHVYGHSDRGDWTCMDVTNGNVAWKNRGVRKGAVVYADGHLYCRSESGAGTVALVEATPTGYVEKGRFDQPDRSGKQTWAHPVVVNGRLFLRDQDVLLCFDVRG